MTKRQKTRSVQARRGRAGQATVEMVLITAILTGACIFVLNEFKKDPNKNPVYQFVSGPWKAVAGMMESGLWKKRNPAGCGEACEKHPNRWHRAYSAWGQSL